jgi:hypothetical protein
MARLPHREEGQQRDDIAYVFAAWLVRDLHLPDDVALSWLHEWDAGNRPPKGDARLVEIISNAHKYGQRAYGNGLLVPRASLGQGKHCLTHLRFIVEL